MQAADQDGPNSVAGEARKSRGRIGGSQGGDGIGGEGSQIGDIQAQAPRGTGHILPNDTSIHVDKRQRDGETDQGQQHGQREEGLPTEELQDNYNHQQQAQPDHKDVRVQAQAGETIGGLIKQQALECRDQYHAHQQYHEDAQSGEGPTLRRVLAFDNGAEAQEEQQAAEGHADQLAETAAGILGVGIALHADIDASAEEILELDDDEDGKEEDDRPQYHGGFGEAQELRYERLFTPQFLLPAFAGGVQEDTRQGIRADEYVEEPEEVLRKVLQTEEAGKVLQAPGEDQVGGSEQEGENHHDRQGNQEPAQDGPEALPAGAGNGGGLRGACGSEEGGLPCFQQECERADKHAAGQPDKIKPIIRQAIPGPAPAEVSESQKTHQPEGKEEGEGHDKGFAADEGEEGEEEDGNEQEQGPTRGTEAVQPEHQEAAGQAEQDVHGEIEALGVFPEEEIKAPAENEGRDPEKR